MDAQRLAIFDLDGTLMRGAEAIPGAIEAVRRARDAGRAVRVLTNNSGASTQDLLNRLRSAGFEFEEQEVYGTATAAAHWCRDAGIQRVYLIGEPALREVFVGSGFDVVQAGADAVVVGVCRKDFGYDLLDGALQCFLAGARFVATNRDRTYPLEGGRLQPGAGIMVGAVAGMIGSEPEIVIGKPNPWMVERLMKSVGAIPETTIVIGDRPETDLECGKALGCRTWLVLTGVTDELGEWQGGRSLAELEF